MSRAEHPPGEPFRTFCSGCDRERDCHHIVETRTILCLECWRQWSAQARPARAMEQLELFPCRRCGNAAGGSDDGLCPLCEWRLDDERAFAQIKGELAEDAAREQADEGQA